MSSPAGHAAVALRAPPALPAPHLLEKVPSMTERITSTLVIGLLAAVSVLLTSYLIPVPIWVVFIAWASFFAAGGGYLGARSTLIMGFAGAASATATLIVASALGGAAWVVALCCIAGAGVLVAIGHFPFFAFTPAGFFGFASTAGTLEATGRLVTDPPTFSHPSLLVLGAFIVGTGFGIASEVIPRAVGSMLRSPAPAT